MRLLSRRAKSDLNELLVRVRAQYPFPPSVGNKTQWLEVKTLLIYAKFQQPGAYERR
ncbi:hypothetical protein NCPPB1935_01235 [Xanthomonas campestris pv. nigromaculans]|nr:hypothetical protein CFBP2044_02420 [Xanthomonas hortorum pv. cynarae]CAD0300601.1 hypothetical protein CFBP2044_02420 [Xanthomonas hortorum pv. cynarae]CAH2706398.1 hypothetical protein NCPPB1935_01235 [Xanthomonas campestris pv. nigromaculans]